jgi:hypothetical protein
MAEFKGEKWWAVLDDNQFAALVSFAFNAGNGALKGSTLRKKLNKKDYKGAAGEFRKWVYGTIHGRKVLLPGLVRRRAQERNLFLNLPVVLDAAPRMAISAGPIAAKGWSCDVTSANHFLSDLAMTFLLWF